MNNIKQVNDCVNMLSLNVSGILFEELWEIPDGVTINSYVVKGEQTALIDGVCGWDGVPFQLYQMLDKIDVDLKNVKYLIINHMEPDHSGWINDFKKVKDDFEIYCTKKAADLIEAFYGKMGNVHVVKKGDTLDLGNGVVLEFLPIPNLHWPDTMMTIEKSTNTIFTCDMFGSFGQIQDGCFDNEIDIDDEYWTDNMIRYFSNVMATYRSAAKRAVGTIRALNPSIIAPAHGPVYKNPAKILDKYEEIIDMIEVKPLKEIAIIYSSMYGMTEQAVMYAKELIEAAGIKAHLLKTSTEHIGNIVSKAYRCAGILIASPTYENAMLPDVAHTIDELGRKKITDKKVMLTGSYGWSPQHRKDFDEIVEKHSMKWEVVADYPFLGMPKEEDYQKIKEAVETLINNI